MRRGLIHPRERNHARDCAPTQVGAEIDDHVMGAGGWVHQLPQFHPRVIALIHGIDEGQTDPIVSDGGDGFEVVIVDRDPHDHQAFRAGGGMGYGDA